MDTGVKKPNFFIIGAPRCGTTALSEYLTDHPDVFFSKPKELNYFCTDFDPKYRLSFNEKDYLKNFVGADRFKAVGEGTIFYLYSNKAVSNILKFNPEAKFIVMIRNPIDAAYSLQQRLYFFASEDVENFERAWRLQDYRKKGEYVPKNVPERTILYYRDVYKMGDQIERLLKIVPRDRVKIIEFDNFIKDTTATYQEVLEFLGLPDDGRRRFKKINVQKRPISPRLNNLLRHPPRKINKFFSAAEILSKPINLRLALIYLNSKKNNRPPLSRNFRKELVSEFKPDIQKLSSILKKDLSEWLKVK